VVVRVPKPFWLNDCVDAMEEVDAVNKVKRPRTAAIMMKYRIPSFLLSLDYVTTRPKMCCNTMVYYDKVQRSVKRQCRLQYIAP